MSDSHTIPVFYVANFLDFAIDDERVKQDILDKAGLASMDPTQLISIATLVQLIEATCSYNPSPSLAIEFGRHLSPISHGILSQLVISSSSLKDIVSLISKYSVLRTSLVDISFREGCEFSEIKLLSHAKAEQVSNLLVDVAISCIISVFEFVTGGRFVSSQVLLVRAKPLNNPYFSRVKPPLVKYQQDRNAIVFATQLLSSHCDFSDKDIFKGVLHQCEAELDKLSAQTTLSEQLEELLNRDLIKFSRCSYAAAYFNITTRTLRRRLEKKGQSFQAIVDEFRQCRAEQLLCNTSHSINHIAETLGFTDASSFGKAFRKNAGCSPSQYRKAGQEQAIKIIENNSH